MLSLKISLHKVQLSLLCLFIILKPIYIFDSGLPQVSDFFMLLFIVTTLIQGVVINRDIINFSIFSLLVCFVNAYWSFYYNTFTPVLYSLFYVYNFLAFSAVIAYFKKNPFDKLASNNMLWILLFTLMVQFIFSLFLKSVHIRQVILFNNPNQLGYWSLCCLVFAFLLHRKGGSDVLFYICVLFSIYFSGLSLSKASMLSMFIFFLVYNFRVKKFLVFLMLLLPLSLASYDFFVDTEFGKNIVHRLNDIGQASDDNAEGRGYDRIIKYPEYLSFGAGEGAPHEFIVKNDIPPELHSSLGTALFSYGIIGFSMICGLFYFVTIRSLYTNLVVLLPLFSYSLTHQGLRSTFFWIIVAMLIVISEKIPKEYNLTDN